MTLSAMTCQEFQSLVTGYLEEEALSAEQRAAADAHRLDCADCAALVADVRLIVQQAGDLPLLEPSHDLWSGVEQRIAAQVVALPVVGSASSFEAELEGSSAPAGTQGRMAHQKARREWSPRRLAVAASLLIVATAGITWRVASDRSAPVNSAESGSTPAAGSAGSTTPAVQASHKPSLDETYDREIAGLRTLVDQRRAELDSATITILEKNLKVIDNAIRESKAALAQDPASAFLTERLSRAYDSKLQLMRDVATLPTRS